MTAFAIEPRGRFQLDAAMSFIGGFPAGIGADAAELSPRGA
jgi:hypothetical protein